jgi:hypothetical protein
MFLNACIHGTWKLVSKCECIEGCDITSFLRSSLMLRLSKRHAGVLGFHDTLLLLSLTYSDLTVTSENLIARSSAKVVTELECTPRCRDS